MVFPRKGGSKAHSAGILGAGEHSIASPHGGGCEWVIDGDDDGDDHGHGA